MWHGTSADFTVFDINKAGQNWGGDSRLGKGFYFANTREDALRWTDGSKAVKAYLNITNPLDVDAPAPSNIVSEIDKYIDNKITSFDESKSFVSKEIHKWNPQLRVWQTSFHDHVIRGENDYLKIWQYIDDNPAKWDEDCFYVTL